MDHFQSKFVEEATELIVDLEQALLNLESNQNDKESIGLVFRVMHTLKGNSSMFGFDKIGEFTHHLETIYDFVRQGKMKLTDEIFNVTLKSVDHLSALLNDINLTDPVNKDNHVSITQQVLNIINLIGHNDLNTSSDFSGNDDDSYGLFEEASTYHIFFKPKENIFSNGTNPLFLIDELHGLGQVKAYPNLSSLPGLQQINISSSYIYWDIFLSTYKNANDISDVFIFVEDDCDLVITKLIEKNLFFNESFFQRIESLLKEKININLIDIQQIVLNTIDNTNDQVVFENVKEEKLLNVNSQTKEIRDIKDSSISSIRVSSFKIDEMMNLVSELVTSQARLSLLVEHYNIPELMAIAENMQKLSRQLRDNAFSISLIPLQSIVTRFQRLVRDLSHELKKDIEFITEGTETELDKTIIENLTDPIMHILRNSLDHGIEDAEVRTKTGKPAKGKIILSAFYSGAYVYIEVKDDGAGINPEIIREKAISKGLIAADASLTQKEIFDLVFQPGFSTAKVVTDVSGRGVGMDVVRRKISDIRGEVEIDSKIGHGTTITIKLPLTLSIIDGLLVLINDTYFILQLAAVKKIYSITHKEVQKAQRNMIILDGESIPFYYLRDEFEMGGTPFDVEQVIVVMYQDSPVGLIIDKVVGEYQAVIKPLGKHYKNQDMISGASILGDGTIALVTDTNKIIKKCSRE
ncbi:MAG TPA: chemotaxis protein CheA [Bacteroidales bacterium]|nr:MAG: hypothetical protein A2X01_10645 [Bacteroidetes bacterium GWF2_35_48]OFZ02246.1 MAG: hypothetical protein A2491_15195 [Bacteroidetes bacterium RIFOXYC12_FULL_35_7]HBX49892.1 chemotaxis protein CheA [Bacteroidales bacterium]